MTYWQNNADTRDYVNRDVPEMEEANDVSETQDDHENHQNADLNVAEKKKSDDNDASYT